jgi:hypothetical protein
MIVAATQTAEKSVPKAAGKIYSLSAKKEVRRNFELKLGFWLYNSPHKSSIKILIVRQQDGRH